MKMSRSLFGMIGACLFATAMMAMPMLFTAAPTIHRTAGPPLAMLSVDPAFAARIVSPLATTDNGASITTLEMDHGILAMRHDPTTVSRDPSGRVDKTVDRGRLATAMPGYPAHAGQPWRIASTFAPGLIDPHIGTRLTG